MPISFQKVFLTIGPLFAGCLLSTAAEELISFSEDIRPILSDNCYYCHGPDKETQEADLRLDTFEDATRDLGGYAAIVPGDPEASELIYRIHDEEDLMPPDSSKKVLTEEEKELLSRWIEQGAQYEPHWSFQPLKDSPLPEVRNTGWVKNGIDRFVLARLEEKRIEPSPEAAREVLIRRLYLDLVGLLPEPEEVRDFVEDDREDAYERLVDRLLASPHYGERWGRHWLDQARYADSDGYSIDAPRQMWPYRDWVIRAHNEDMPFDQFTIEQLAGDLLDNPSKSQLIATAFHRNSLINLEGGVDPEQFRVEAVLDRTNTTGAVWLGLTLGCAQCHTHKFDPIQHREYFEMFAFFNNGTDRNSKGKTILVREGEVFGKPVPPRKGTITRVERNYLKAEWEKSRRSELRKKERDFEREVWKTIVPDEAGTLAGASLVVLPDQSILVDSGLGFRETFVVKTVVERSGVSRIRLRAIPHESLPSNGPGQAKNGNFVVTAFEVWSGGERQKLTAARADHAQPGYSEDGLIDEDPKTGWAINVPKGSKGVLMNAPHDVELTLEQPLSPGPLEIRLRHDANANYHIGHFAIDISNSEPGKEGQLLSVEERELLVALNRKAKQRTEEQKAVVEEFFKAEVPRGNLEVRGASREIAELMVMEDMAQPRKTFLLTRGDFTRPDFELGELYPGGLSKVAPPLPPKKGRTRLDLAKWLVDPENPLTPRVTMNRMWMRYFGRGIVETEEDFGTQGASPTHPKLLDWLGLRFIESGWSMKAMHRLIVTSATYRQSSKARPDLDEIDARNLLLARQNRIRVEAEIVRDAALCASGLLNPKIGGPGTFPEQPEGVYAFTQKGKPWPTSQGRERFRRALYTTFYRSAPYPLFGTFDAPDFSTVCTRRVKSNTPLQALNLANDPVFLEFARALALRLHREHPGDAEAQIERGIELCFSREPTSKEKEILREFIRTQKEAWGEDLQAAGIFAGPELRQRIATEDAAALVSLARVFINTDNFITRE